MKTNSPKRKVSKKQPVPNAKSTKLARLRKLAHEAWRAREAAGVRILTDHPLNKKWYKLNRQVSRLEESFVVYQGQDVDAVQVNYMSGDISITDRMCIEGDESIHRDAQGRYFLFRDEGKSTKPKVHRLSLTAAILWACTRANRCTSDLRRDAFNLLAKLRPFPEKPLIGVNEMLPAEPESDGYSAIHHVAATEEDCGFEYRVVLPPKEAEYGRDLAKLAGMPFEEFMQKYLEGVFTEESLRDKAPPEVKEVPTLESIDADTLARLQRIADFKGVTIAEMIDEEFDQHITCYEDDWLFHPETGELLGDTPPWWSHGRIRSRITARPLSEQAQKGGAQ